ncbi:MAG: hypothetical protein ACE3JK_14060 [Sporolactobacillus sp.]
MTKEEMVARLNELNHQLNRTTDATERETLKLEINALEQGLVGKVREHNRSLSF